MTDIIKPPEDSDSLAPTLRPKPKMPSLSSRPTIPIQNKTKVIKEPWYRRHMHIILIGMIIFLICESVFIVYKYKTRVIDISPVTYNIPAIIVPPLHHSP